MPWITLESYFLNTADIAYVRNWDDECQVVLKSGQQISLSLSFDEVINIILERGSE